MATTITVAKAHAAVTQAITIQTGFDDPFSVSSALELMLLVAIVGPVGVLGTVGGDDEPAFAIGAGSLAADAGGTAVLGVVVVVVVLTAVAEAATVEIVGTAVVLVVRVEVVAVVVVVVVVVMVVVGQRPSPGWQSGWSATRGHGFPPAAGSRVTSMFRLLPASQASVQPLSACAQSAACVVVVAAVVVVGVVAVRVLVTGVLDAMLGERGVAAEGSMVVVSASFTPSATHTYLVLSRDPSRS